jgi:putative aldouronate transport system permease protein
MRKIKSTEELFYQAFVNLILVLVLLVVCIPLLRVITMSVTPIKSGRQILGGLFIPFADWSWGAYKQLLTHPAFFSSLKNSAIILALGTTVNLILTIPIAYVLSIKGLPGRKFLNILVLIPFLFNPGLIPTYLVVTNLGLIDSYWAVILPGAISVYNVFVMRGFFEGIPEDFKEAARIDGAGEFYILSRIILPLSKPIILTIGLFYGVSHWNEFFAPLLYLNDSKLQPLPVLLRNILLAANVNEYVDFDAMSAAPVQALKAASVILTTLPMVVVYPWIQKHFTKGTLVGGIKG